jgi:hypothetical protein
MFHSREEQIEYIKETYPDVTDHRIGKEYWDLYCDECEITRGFFLTEHESFYRRSNFSGVSLLFPDVYTFHCPVCKASKMWLLFAVVTGTQTENGMPKEVVNYYRVTSLPGEGLEDIAQLPESPSSLRIAYKQAIRAMDANAHMAAAAMFRRALQIITRNILSAPPGNLGNELKALVGTQHNGVTLGNSFASNSYIIRESGNQGAHPDKDPDLLDFSQQDAEDLQKIFMELVSDLFVIPEAVEKSRAEFLQRRKITPPAA